MRSVITGRNDVFGPWFCEQLANGLKWFPGKGETIGLVDNDRRPIACCMYEGWNGASVSVHLVGLGNWLNKEFLWYCFHYPFEELKVTKILAPIESDNFRSIRFTKHIGFSLEATLKDASPKGDLLIFSMTKDQCRWLSLRNRNVKATSSGDT